MPPSQADFPAEVQVAFFVFSYLTDRYAGMGDYIGKDWSSIEAVFDLLGIEDRKTVFYFMKMYENILVEYISSEKKKQLEAEERRRKSAAEAGKNYTHNVKG